MKQLLNKKIEAIFIFVTLKKNQLKNEWINNIILR